MTVDRRTNPEESLESERARLLECIERVKQRGTVITVEVLQEGDASQTDAGSGLAGALQAAITTNVGKPAEFELCPGLLETRYYARFGIPALAYGPGELRVSHGPSEFIDLRRMFEAAAVYAATASLMLG